MLVGRAQIRGIVDSVRTIVLEWSLKLEKDGILGDRLSFSREEKEKASAFTFNIQNFTGVAGSVQADFIQVGDYNTIHPELKRLGIPQKERNELEEVLDRLNGTTDQEEKKSMFKRGMDWLQRNAASLGTLSETIRGWIETLAK